MKYLSAVLLALAVIAAQALHGGALDPALAEPAYLLLVLAGMAASVAVWRNRCPVAPGALLAVCLLVGYILWRCVNAADPFSARPDFSAALAGFLAFVAAACGLPDAKSRLTFLGVLGVAAIAQSITGIIQFGRGEDFVPLGWFSEELRRSYAGRFPTRAHGFYLNPNHYAWLCGWAALFSVALGCWGRVSNIARIVLVYFALFFISCDVLTGSRGGMLSLIAGLAAFTAISIAAILAAMRRGRFAFVSGAVLLISLCAGAGYFVYTSNWVMQGRVEATFLGDIRSHLFEQAWRHFQTAPLLGSGSGTFVYAARISRVGIQPGDAIYAHDDWMQILVEYGVVGLSLAALAAAVLFSGGIKRFFAAVRFQAAHDDRPFSNSAAILIGSVSALVMFAVHSTIDFNMHIPANSLLAGATLGLLASRKSVSASPRIETGIMRAFGFVILAALTASLSLYLLGHARSDYENLRASDALAAGDVQTALARTERGLKSAPDDAGLLFTRGRAFYNYESSLALETDSSSFVDDDAEIVGKAPVELSAADREKTYRSAVDAFRAAVARRPEERSYHIELAKALVELGEDKAARHEFLEAIRLDPNNGYPYGAYGDYLFDHEDLRAAQAIFSLGQNTSNGGYSGERYADVMEELASAPEQEAAPKASPDSSPGEPPKKTSDASPTGPAPEETR